ncbi:MAG: glucosaminidase domain-containing protein [Crocinitomicaceae bacterium]|nr:glucosaminidase domain-containing protein [Crocinitomicaceae bacterium]
MKRVITISALLLAGTSLASDARITKSEYVDQWKATAIQQMVDNKVPASITLAQGILESASGNSSLAIKGNNHFGIKCHGWTGNKMYLDDDKSDECFRVYKTADESYQDHSEFLMGYSRYAFLFTYDVTDYKAWARGLKKAGYATNPKYPDLLIGIIEDLRLDQYDKAGLPSEGYKPELVVSIDTYSNKHNVIVHESKVKYIRVKKGDTFYKISKEFGLNLSQLHRYNNFDGKKYVLEEGDIVYIMPKRRRGLFKNKEIVAKTDMTVEELSQTYATNVKSIKRLNNFADDTIVSKGDLVTLR